MKYLLDTSALLAHFFEEPGAARIQEILEDKEAKVYISGVSTRAFEIVASCTSRLPLIDALIASYTHI